MTGDGFQSETAAKSAGKQALQDFLSDLAKEEKPKITDQLTLDRIKELIAKLEWQKAAFHSEQEQGRLGWRPLSFGLAPP
jgi:hypothetical protein